MKKIKLFLLPLLLIAVVTLFSFTNKKEQAAGNTDVHFYILSNGGDPYTEADYTVRVEEMPASCGGDDEVCWIRATDNGNGEPQIDGTLSAEIFDALDDNLESTNVKLKN